MAATGVVTPAGAVVVMGAGVCFVRVPTVFFAFSSAVILDAVIESIQGPAA